MANNNSIDDFVGDVIRAHDEQESLASAATVATQRPAASSESALGVLPGHAVERLIARGGMGAVYLAKQEALEREVAVKVMTGEAESPEMAARFRREALVLGKLAHPNIVPVYDIGTDADGGLFYTMKLVKGRTLQAILHDLRQENVEALKEHTLTSLLTVFQKVCDAMAFAHSQGIIHRDLKPENIMVGEFGEVLVMDWGLAKLLRSNDEVRMTNDEDAAHSEFDIPHSSFSGTLSGSVMGTPQYMSPEQAMGKIDELDARSDIFSLGGILYAILTLRPPVEGKTLQEVLEKVKSGEIASPTDLVGGTTRRGIVQEKGDVLEAKAIKPLPHAPGGRVPPALSAVAMKALSVAKADRYAEVMGLSGDVEKFQTGFATSAEAAGFATQVKLLIKRNRGIFSTAAAALFLLASLVVWFVFNLKEKERETRQQAELARAAEAVAVQERETARQALAKSQLDLAEKEFERGKFVESQKILDETPEDFRDANWRFLQAHASDFTAEVEFKATGSVHWMEFLPQGDRFVFRTFYRSIGVFTLSGQQVGSWMDVNTPHYGGHASAPGIDGAGERIAFPVSATEIGLQDVASGTLVRSWKSGLNSIRHLRLSPDGGTVLAIGGGKLIAYSAETGAALWTQPCHGALPALSQDGQKVAVVASMAGLSVKIQLLDMKTGAVRDTLEATADNPKKERLQFSQTGDRLACLGGDEVIFWNLKTGAKIRALHFPGEMAIQTSPDGNTVATISGSRIRLWDATTGELLRSLNGVGNAILNVAFSPDGTMLISSEASGHQGVVKIWPTRLGEAIASMPPTYGLECTVFDRESSGFFIGGGAGLAAWDLKQDLKKKWELSEKVGRVVDVATHPSDGTLVFQGFEQRPMTHVSDTGEVLGSFDGYTHASIQFDQTGQLLLVMNVTGGGSAFKVMAYPSGEVLHEVVFEEDFDHPRGTFCLNDTAVATAALTGGITVWDWKLGVPLRVIDAAETGTIAALAASPDGQRLATCGPDRWIRVWEAATGRLETAFRAHWEGVRCVAFSPDGRELLSGSELGTVRIHDVATGEERLALYGLTTPVDEVHFSPDGALISASASRLLKVWDRKRSSAAALLPQGLPTDRD